MSSNQSRFVKNKSCQASLTFQLRAELLRRKLSAAYLNFSNDRDWLMRIPPERPHKWTMLVGKWMGSFCSQVSEQQHGRLHQARWWRSQVQLNSCLSGVQVTEQSKLCFCWLQWNFVLSKWMGLRCIRNLREGTGRMDVQEATHDETQPSFPTEAPMDQVLCLDQTWDACSSESVDVSNWQTKNNYIFDTKNQASCKCYISPEFYWFIMHVDLAVMNRTSDII